MHNARIILLGFIGGLLGACVGNVLLRPETARAQIPPPDATFNTVKVAKLFANGLDIVDPHSKGLMSLYFNNAVPTIALLPEGNAESVRITPSSIQFDFSHVKEAPTGSGFAKYANTGMDFWNIGAKSEIYADTVGDSGKPQLVLKILAGGTQASTLTVTGLKSTQ